MNDSFGKEKALISVTAILFILSAILLTPGQTPPQIPGPIDRRPPGDFRQINQNCPNGNLEFGTLQGWQAFNGSRLNSPNFTQLSAGAVNGRHTIRSLANGADPQLSVFNVTLNQVGEGSSAVRLGNSATGGQAEALAYTFTVNQFNQNFSFRYAVVLQNPNHTANQQPFFGYYILPGSSIFPSVSNVTVVSQRIVANPANPFFRIAGGIVYRDWTPTCIDLSRFVGQTMTIVFYTADCSLGAHYGYAYIDGLCNNNQAVASLAMPNEICAGAELFADGSASENETSHFWSIEESDANGGRKPGTEVSEWFVAQQAGNTNLTSFYASKGGEFKCNKYYRIKLAVNNDCTQWNESVQLLHVKCPPVTAGRDLCVSCTPNDQLSKLGIGNTAIPGLTYIWSPATGLDNPSSPTPFHLPGSIAYPVTYTVKATGADGCLNSDQVTLYCQPPTLNLEMDRKCCGATLRAVAAGYQRINWSTGQSGVTSIEVANPGSYTVTASNPCGTTTKTTVVPANNGLTGSFNPIAANSRFCPPYGTPICENKLHIKDVITGNGTAGAPNAYNATQYQLEIYDRGGLIVKVIPGQSCGEFANWSISWDGTNESGQLVKQDVYNWKLRLKNCQNDWAHPKVRRFADRYCVKWAKFLGLKLWCKEYNVPPGTTVDEVVEVGSVAVVR
jgi:hypothetical protein